MYQVGEKIIYGTTGVCEIRAIGPLNMEAARKGVDYYTLVPVYQDGIIFAPVDTAVPIRPVLTEQQALSLIRKIPAIEENVFENNNPRLLNEHYQIYLKSGDCTDLIRLIRAIYAKGRRAAQRGKHLGQVDRSSMERAEKLLHSELACALGIRPDGVSGFIARTLEG